MTAPPEMYAEFLIGGSNPPPVERRQIKNVKPHRPLAFLDVSFYPTLCQNQSNTVSVSITIYNHCWQSTTTKAAYCSTDNLVYSGVYNNTLQPNTVIRDKLHGKR